MSYPAKPLPTFAPPYVTLYPLLAEVAREHGYALCVHGSLNRDFDLVAVPWVDQADPAEQLIESLANTIGARIGSMLPGVETPNPKPHGRRGWSLCLGKAYLDVSVMPRKEAAGG